MLQAPFSRELVAELNALAALVFDEPGFDVSWRLSAMPVASVALARSGAALVGFKAGYAMTETKYYSWLGGVHPDARGQGIARRLMRLQHAWVRERGCALVETAASEENAAMTRLNLQEGFTVCGSRREPGRVQVLFLKTLR